MESVLKWVGGKRQLLGYLLPIIQSKLNGHNRYYEPFVGGGSVAFALEYNNTIINDLNSELINVYKMIKENPKILTYLLTIHQDKHYSDSNYYYDVRQLDRLKDYKILPDVVKASRIIYLNKTCFNGLYRVNSKGFFNVPKGKQLSKVDIVMIDKIYNLSNYLNSNNVVIRNEDFRKCISDCRSGDVIYFDPPYDYENSGFTSYVKDGFNKKDLLDLKNICDELIEKGCFVVISNNDTEYVRQLFSDSKYTIKEVLAKRSINSNGKKRSNAKEVIIYGDEK